MNGKGNFLYLLLLFFWLPVNAQEGQGIEGLIKAEEQYRRIRTRAAWVTYGGAAAGVGMMSLSGLFAEGDATGTALLLGGGTVFSGALLIGPACFPLKRGEFNRGLLNLIQRDGVTLLVAGGTLLVTGFATAVVYKHNEYGLASVITALIFANVTGFLTYNYFYQRELEEERRLLISRVRLTPGVALQNVSHRPMLTLRLQW